MILYSADEIQHFDIDSYRYRLVERIEGDSSSIQQHHKWLKTQTSV